MPIANTIFSDKLVLVIDDSEGMRTQLRISLSASGFGKLHLVGSIKDALDKMSLTKYDVILCDYSLGESTNGQQFLEYLRTNDLIRRNTIFVMISAEQSYEKVVGVSECAPDDYLLKPFTAAQFNARLEKLLERQLYFAAIDKATDNKDWLRVLAECEKLLAKPDKYFFDIAKIKGVALLRANRVAAAVEHYQSVLSQRAIGWAKLGLAKARAATGDAAAAQQLLNEIIRETPQFMAAYDFLAKLQVDAGKTEDAYNVLLKARLMAPGTMSRVRELSSLAVETGKPEVAESVMRETLKRHRYSPVRQANDYALLSKALVKQGKAEDALSFVKEAQQSFKDEKSQILLAASESVAHKVAGKPDLAEAALGKAMALGTDLGSLSADALLAMAEACFANGKEGEATRLLQYAVQNHDEDRSVGHKLHSIMVAAGKDPSEAAALITSSQQQIIELNNDGVRKAQAGQLAEAIKLLSQAAERLPNNLQIVSNVALVLALDLTKNGNSAEKMAKCLGYREALARKSPNYPKLEQIDSLLRQLKA